MCGGVPGVWRRALFPLDWGLQVTVLGVQPGPFAGTVIPLNCRATSSALIGLLLRMFVFFSCKTKPCPFCSVIISSLVFNMA